MNIDQKIEDLRKEFNEKIKELKREYKEKNEKWIPESGERYYFVDIDLTVGYSINLLDSIDNLRFEFIKIFKTKEEAQEYADYLKARKKYSYEFSKEEWEDKEIDKYYIYYDYRYKKIGIGIYMYFNDMNTIYFKSGEQAQEFVNKYEKQILKFEFDIEEKNNE